MKGRLEAALEEITRLKDENRHLREQMARLFGERRAASMRPRTTQESDA